MSQRRLFYGWVVVFAAATVVAFGQGSLFSLGVFLKPLEDSMRWSRSAVSVTALINWMAMGVGSFVWGAVSDRLGARFVAIAGGLLLGASLVLSRDRKSVVEGRSVGEWGSVVTLESRVTV